MQLYWEAYIFLYTLQLVTLAAVSGSLNKVVKSMLRIALVSSRLYKVHTKCMLTIPVVSERLYFFCKVQCLYLPPVSKLWHIIQKRFILLKITYMKKPIILLKFDMQGPMCQQILHFLTYRKSACPWVKRWGHVFDV